MENAVRVVKARPEDLEAIVTIINAGASSVRRGREHDDWRLYREAYDALLAAPEMDIYVALDGAGTVVGTFQIHFLKGLAFKGRPRVELESVHVRKDWQGRGVGRKMLALAEDLARAADASMLQLTSNREREGAYAFYTALGFQQSHLGYKKMLV